MSQSSCMNAGKQLNKKHMVHMKILYEGIYKICLPFAGRDDDSLECQPNMGNACDAFFSFTQLRRSFFSSLNMQCIGSRTSVLWYSLMS